MTTVDAVALRSSSRVEADFVRLFLSYWRGSLLGLAFIIGVVVLTGRAFAPDVAWLAWGAAALGTCVAEAAVCRLMERDMRAGAGSAGRMRWLLASIFLSGVSWGLLPCVVAASSTPALMSTVVLDAMLLVCIANSPGTQAMSFVSVPPIAILGTLALIGRHGLLLAGVAYFVVVAFIALYGYRLKAALTEGLLQRHAAEDLAIELRDQQQRTLVLERERTLLLERQRLMRDMHDGLGSSLVGALAAIEHGRLGPQHVGALIRDCIDDLRAVIDSLEPAEADLAAVLGSLRSRMERRLHHAGVRLEWQVLDVPRLAWMGHAEALHVTRIVQELLSNSLKHARARLITLSALASESHVEVRIADDGVGFDAGAVHEGRGLGHLNERAARLGGAIVVESRVGLGTSACLRLPLTRDAVPAHTPPP